MKGFITFLAVTVLAILITVYDTDMAKYTRKQEEIKATAESMASGAGLYYDDYNYSMGYMKFNREEGRKCMEHIIKNKFKNEIVFYDINYTENVENPAVEVTLTVKGKDMFRLPFLKVNTITRKAKYELPEA